jgi:hypothetical protein
LEEAQRLMAQSLCLTPGWRRTTYVHPQWIRSSKLRAEFLEAFIAAGLPE